MVRMIGETVGLEGRITITGHQTGHLGGTDIIVGMNTFLGSGADDETILIGASAAYVFGTAIMIAPQHVASQRADNRAEQG